MRYLGGKSRLAKDIARVINPCGTWWDPFCGGLSVAKALAEIYPEGLVSDVNEALITTYRAVQAGWEPPETATKEEYDAGKLLPDSDPMKAFLGFGCSYGGKWFGGFKGSYTTPASLTHPYGMKQDFPGSARAALLRDLRPPSPLAYLPIVNRDFLSAGLPATGSCGFECIYLDPPYAGTTGYSACADFNDVLFWQRVAEWTEFCRVFVSELECPIPNEVVWSRAYEKRVGSMGQENDKQEEKLFLIFPQRIKK